MPRPINQLRRNPVTIFEEQSPSYPNQENSLQGNDSNLVTVLGELTNSLNKVVKRLDKQESRLKSIEKKLLSTAVLVSQASVPSVVREV